MQPLVYIISSNEGQEVMVVHAGDETGFAGGAELIFDSLSKPEDFHRDMIRINHRKCMNENHKLNMSLRSIFVTGNAS
jgi:hypothetical protein